MHVGVLEPLRDLPLMRDPYKVGTMSDLDDIPISDLKNILEMISVDNISKIMKGINNNPSTGH